MRYVKRLRKLHGKVRLFITPKRMVRGDRYCQGTCPIALSALDRLNLRRVSVGATDLVGQRKNGTYVRLVPATAPDNAWYPFWNAGGTSHGDFIRRFDRGYLAPGRKNVTYRVFVLHDPKDIGEAKSRLDDVIEQDARERELNKG